MLAIVRASKPTATAAIAVATAAALRKERSAVPPPPHRSSSIDHRRSLSSNKLGWHDVGGDRGLRGEPLTGIEPGHVEPPLAHWEKRSHALIGLLVERCVGKALRGFRGGERIYIQNRRRPEQSSDVVRTFFRLITFWSEAWPWMGV